MRIAWLFLALACERARATPLAKELPPAENPMAGSAVRADETHAPAPVDALTMPPMSRVFDKVEFAILLPSNRREEVNLEWTGYFLADGQKLPNTDFKIVKVMGRGAVGSIVASKLSAPDKLPSANVRLFSPRVEH